MNIQSTPELQRVLANISFGPSGVMLDKMGIEWEVRSTYSPIDPLGALDLPDEVMGLMRQDLALPEDANQFSGLSGWHIRLTFLRPDNRTKEMGRGAGRWELVEVGASETSVVKTCWILLELLVRHELMESFQYNNVRLFDPHADVDALYAVNKDRGGLR